MVLSPCEEFPSREIRHEKEELIKETIIYDQTQAATPCLQRHQASTYSWIFLFW
jgi:hypothetical protein